MRLTGRDPVSAHVEGIFHVLRTLDLDGEGPTAHPGVGFKNDEAEINNCQLIFTLMITSEIWPDIIIRN